MYPTFKVLLGAIGIFDLILFLLEYFKNITNLYKFVIDKLLKL